MKATGIVRRIDDLGRVVVPKEIRRVLRIREGDPLEIYTGVTGEVILKKYSPIGELNDIADMFAESASSALASTVLITDTDRFIAAYGTNVHDYLNKEVDENLDNIIQKKQEHITDTEIVVPILNNGDPIGSVVILPAKGNELSDTEFTAARLGADFLAKQMDN
ncbi:MAG: stage V sporulation T C-terminal domain-containing protein [Bacillota bacterium]|nr:stage V sporulation T C-terminal domain-containing protein [Bacillota bacterium]